MLMKLFALIVGYVKRKRKISYTSYIRSKTWEKKADRIRQIGGFRCADCGGRGWQVHHKTYERLGREIDSDLILLCAKCHKRRHGK